MFGFGLSCIKVELAGLGGYGAALFCGTGCFHRRECLFGKKHSKDYRGQWNTEGQNTTDRSIQELEESAKTLITCSYEKGTKWGKEVSLSLFLFAIPCFRILDPNITMKYMLFLYADGTDVWMPG